MGKECVLSTGNLLREGLPRNSVDRITDHPDMTLAVDRGRKALTKPKKKACMSLNLGWVPQLTLELAALECLKNRCIM